MIFLDFSLPFCWWVSCTFIYCTCRITITVYVHTFENYNCKCASIRFSSGLTFSYVSLRSPEYLRYFAAFHIITCEFPHFRESEGSFGFGNYLKEADDLHSVIQHFCEANRIVCAILGHSKGEWIDLGVLLIDCWTYTWIEKKNAESWRSCLIYDEEHVLPVLD